MPMQKIYPITSVANPKRAKKLTYKAEKFKVIITFHNVFELTLLKNFKNYAIIN